MRAYSSGVTFVPMDLVRRDPAIPGLAVVFDCDAFADALRRAAPEVDLRTTQITYVRYKPGAFCRVAYRLDLGDTHRFGVTAQF